MKVLFLDGWTGGLHNFVPVARGLEARGVECLLVHRGSWGNDLNRAKEERLDGLLCRDISYYRTRLIHNVLKREAPDVVLLLTTNFFADRSAILAARALGIRSCFLMHGIIALPDARQRWNAIEEKQIKRRRWGRAAKYLRFTLPDYFYSGFMVDLLFPLKLSPYLLLWRTFHNPRRYVMSPPPSPEIHCDHALIWGKIYGRTLCEDFGYPPEHVEIVGHPPLDPVFALRRSPPDEGTLASFLGQYGIEAGTRYCVDLEDAHVEQGVWTAIERLRHLDEMAQLVAKAGLLFVLKLHPGSNEREIREHFSNDPKVRVIRNTDLPMLLYGAQCAIAHTSTTVNSAVCLDKPVFVPCWGLSKNIPDYFVREGVAVGCESPDAMLEVLRNPEAAHDRLKTSTSSYIDRFISFTDGRAMERIVKSVYDLCVSRAAGRPA